MSIRQRSVAVGLALAFILVLLAPGAGSGLADITLEKTDADRLVKIVRKGSKIVVTKNFDGKDVTIQIPTSAPSSRPTSMPASMPVPKTDTIEQCRALYMKGSYEHAAKGFAKLQAVDATRLEASVGLAEARKMQGRYAEAIEALDAAKAGRADVKWLELRARVLADLGRYEEALKAARQANQIKPVWAQGILTHGQMLEILGRKKQAIETYKTMSAVIDGDKYLTDAPALVALGQIMGRYGVLTGQKASEQAANILHNYLQKAYMDVDKRYWPAQMATGQFLLAKHQPAGAMAKFKLAVGINKNIPDAYVGAGAILLAKWNFDKCLASVNKALKINPHHADALVLKGYCLMQWRKFDQVAPVCEKVLKVNPNHPDALSLMAALYIRTGQEDKAKPYIRRVSDVNPTYAYLPITIGQWLSAGRQFDKAEKYYKEAIELAPELADGFTNLGQLYMQTGEEDKARKVLAQARKIDDYRADVGNYLSVLKELEGFAVKETEHFIIKVSAKHDRVLLDRMAAYMEKIYPEICRDFGHEPPWKTIIEVFPTHPGFSKRITGKGWIGTIGACTGRVIALVAPNEERSNFGVFSWPSVLRHEYTHAVTLSATQNRIPHWYTEACAVWEQPDRQSYDAVKKLVAATQTNRLFPIKELNWGFVRPKKRGDRGLAYAQSEWIMEYIITTKGFEATTKMLEAYGKGTDQATVFKDVLGVTEKQFDKKFKAWAKKEVRRWGFDSKAPTDPKVAAAKAKAKPKSAAAQAELAYALLSKRRIKPAKKAATKALALDADNTKALSVLAPIELGAKDYTKAKKLALHLAGLDPSSHVAQRVLAECYKQERDMIRVIGALEAFKLRRPLDPYSYTELAGIYLQLGLPNQAVPNLIELHRRTMKDPSYARAIAEIYGAMEGEQDKSLGFWEQVTQINPYEASAYKAMTEIYINDSRYKEGVATADEMCMADPDAAESWTYAAMARYRLAMALTNDTELRDKQLVEARAAGKRALTIDPQTPQLKDVMELIDSVIGQETQEPAEGQVERADEAALAK